VNDGVEETPWGDDGGGTPGPGGSSTGASGAATDCGDPGAAGDDAGDRGPSGITSGRNSNGLAVAEAGRPPIAPAHVVGSARRSASVGGATDDGGGTAGTGGGGAGNAGAAA